jgi:hypothetical protein
MLMKSVLIKFSKKALTADNEDLDKAGFYARQMEEKERAS